MDVSGREVAFNERTRTKPADQGPLSPRAVEKLYDRSDFAPLRNAGADGLVSKKQHAYETSMQKPQPAGDHEIDGRLPSYDNDVPIRRWVRSNDATSKPHFDHVGNPKPASGGGRNKASGRDIRESPFSAAHFKGRGEG